LGTAAHGYLAGGPPKGWLADGNLVIDRSDGGRFLSLHGVLHPVRNLTSVLLLTGGSRPHTVTVGHGDLTRALIGAPLGIAAAPDAPPPLARSGTPLIACIDSSGTLEVTVGAAVTTSPVQSVLVRDPAGTLQLLWHATRYPIASPLALAALGVPAADARPAPARWLDLFSVGSTLALLHPPARPGRRGPPTVVRDASTGQVAVIQRGRVRVLANRTSLLLLQATPVTVPHATLVGRSQGAPFGYPTAPPSPPAVATPLSGSTACVADTGALWVATHLPGRAAVVVASPTPRPQYVVRQGSVGLLAALPASSGTAAPGPAYALVADGAVFPVPGTDEVRALGYDPAAALRVPLDWLRLLPLGPALALSPLPG